MQLLRARPLAAAAVAARLACALLQAADDHRVQEELGPLGDSAVREDEAVAPEPAHPRYLFFRPISENLRQFQSPISIIMFNVKPVFPQAFYDITLIYRQSFSTCIVG